MMSIRERCSKGMDPARIRAGTTAYPNETRAARRPPSPLRKSVSISWPPCGLPPKMPIIVAQELRFGNGLQMRDRFAQIAPFRRQVEGPTMATNTRQTRVSQAEPAKRYAQFN